MYDPDIFAEIICDKNGIHVDPDIIKMVVRTKGVERIILITESMTSRDNYKNAPEIGLWPGSQLRRYRLSGRQPPDPGKRLPEHDEAHWLWSVPCHPSSLTINPARMLGIDHKVGSLVPGKLANIILIDDMVHIDTVILQGDVMVRNA